MSKYMQRFLAAIAMSLVVACMNSAFGCGMLCSIIMFGIGTSFTGAARKEMEYILPEDKINVDQGTPEHIQGTYERAQALVAYLRENFD